MSEFSAGWPAPAKLNLMLHISGQREDGYHLLQTVFQIIDYCDALDFRVTVDRAIRLHADLKGVPEEANLVKKAAALLQQESGCRSGAEIVLRKSLPMGGGLGGGSSDAATVLVALNHLWGLGFTTGQLADLGVRLGADVPVFVRGDSAWGEGVGEILAPVELPVSWYLVVKPKQSVSTAALFAHPDLTRNCPPITIAAFQAGSRDNVFFPVVKKTCPEVAEVARKLEEFGEARLTGTGSCLFLQFDDEASALSVERRLPEEMERFIARGVNRSPLMQRLENEIIGASASG